MTEYVLIRDYGYEGYGLSFANGEQELYEELKDTRTDIECVFRTSDAICIETFKDSYEQGEEATRDSILAKLTPAEIEFLGLK